MPSTPLTLFRSEAEGSSLENAGELRKALLNSLRASSTLGEIARTVQARDTYQVVFAGVQKGPLSSAGGGLLEAAVRNPKTGRYLQKALLKPGNFNLVSAVSTLAIHLAMQDISAQLGKLQEVADEIKDLMLSQRKGSIISALGQIDRICQTADDIIRKQTLVNCLNTLDGHFYALVSMMQSRAEKLPDPADWSPFNITTSAKEITRNALVPLREEMTLALLCADGIVRAEDQLNGADAAADAMSRVIHDLRNEFKTHEIVQIAIRSWERGLAERPSRFWERVIDALNAAEERLKTQRANPEVTLEVTGAELQQLAAETECDTAVDAPPTVHPARHGIQQGEDGDAYRSERPQRVAPPSPNADDARFPLPRRPLGQGRRRT